jgi:hypothetical protein
MHPVYLGDEDELKLQPSREGRYAQLAVKTTYHKSLLGQFTIEFKLSTHLVVLFSQAAMLVRIQESGPASPSFNSHPLEGLLDGVYNTVSASVILLGGSLLESLNPDCFNAW